MHYAPSTMPLRPLVAVLVAVLVVALSACTTPTESPTLFQSHPPERTGVTFANTLAESTDLNIINYLYYFNGGGVAVGDLNGDDRPDLYFTANEGENALYLNRGDFRFEEVTDAAGVAGSGDWTTGVALADVNGDGRLDLYVSVVNGHEGLTGHNQLYINHGPDAEGIPQFTEEAAAYGLDHRGFSTHATFFDYDRDGDLDLYLLNHSVHDEKTYGRTSLRRQRDPKAGDKLYRNDGDRFVDVSKEAGIIGGAVGYGLGVVATDVDSDGCTDLYIANDFHENDYLYRNNCDGTFRETITEATGHTSRFSMGTDAGDINNDGRPDIVTLDMLPRREEIRKTSVSSESYTLYRLKLQFGYHPQFARNMLHLNQGNGRFSEIGYLAGIEATDWSWAPLFADLDLDGYQDLFISNGIYRRPNDLDYINYLSNREVQASLETITEDNLRLLQRMPQVRIPNAAYRNQGDLTFADSAAAWGLDHEGFSNGAAYADLDGDGDLDLVTNNINEPASIYENRADSLRNRRFLTVDLNGDGQNPFGIGARVTLRYDGQTQIREHTLTRGYQSSVAPGLHFGLGTAETVDSLTVAWPDGRVQTLTDVATNQHVTLRQKDATNGTPPTPPDPAPLRVFDASERLGIAFRHNENDAIDFDREALAPHLLSTEGPALAVADVNGDGRDDVFVGGAKWQTPRLYIQRSDGQFAASDSSAFQPNARAEDVDAAFFDADGDGDPDLYVVSGGGEFWGQADALRDRLYLNDGTGAFTQATDALPNSFVTNGGTVAPADVDGDGDVDLFVGGRSDSRQYGAIPPSALLLNDGTGRFTDGTDDRAPDLRRVGMVTEAAWLDANADGRLDLAVTGTWMPIRLFVQQPDGTFIDRHPDVGLADTGGWWTALESADLDGDGDPDLLAGNLGRNSTLSASPGRPVRMYRGDFDDNGDPEPIITRYRQGAEYPLASRDALLKQMDPLRQRYPTYTSFGAPTVRDVLGADGIEQAEIHEAHTFDSVWIENQGDGTFRVHPLPTRAQFAPIYAIHVTTSNGEDAPTVILGGAFDGVKPNQGRYDASYGLLLTRHNTSYSAHPPAETGLWLRGEVRAFRPITTPDGQRWLLVARNDATLQVIGLDQPRGSALK